MFAQADIVSIWLFRNTLARLLIREFPEVWTINPHRQEFLLRLSYSCLLAAAGDDETEARGPPALVGNTSLRAIRLSGSPRTGAMGRPPIRPRPASPSTDCTDCTEIAADPPALGLAESPPRRYDGWQPRCPDPLALRRIGGTGR